MTFDILIIDDEQDIRDLVSGILEDEGYSTRAECCFVDALSAIRVKSPNLVILDVWLGEGEKDGMRLLEIIKADHRHVPVIMMSGHGTIETAVAAIKRGAHDFIEKPFDSNRLILSVEKAIEAAKLRKENEELKIKARVCDEIVGSSPNTIYIRQSIEKISPLNGRCIIIGPHGSDKEPIAREIHKLSPRSKSPFGIINCRAYSPKQLDIELFGMQITDEKEQKIQQGVIEKTNSGTLFIDDINAAPQGIQLKILKMLKEEAISRIGSSQRVSINVRVIAGATQDIEEMIAENTFSDELYCRLNANNIKIAPLSSRREDVPILLNHFMDQASKAYNIASKNFSADALEVLSLYSWPGEVLQMRNLVDWVLINCGNTDSNGVIEINDLPQEIVDKKPASGGNNLQFISNIAKLSIKEAREAFEREYFIEQLRRFSGNISQTSKFVGMERSALHRKLRSLDITEVKSPSKKE